MPETVVGTSAELKTGQAKFVPSGAHGLVNKKQIYVILLIQVAIRLRQKNSKGRVRSDGLVKQRFNRDRVNQWPVGEEHSRGEKKRGQIL